MDCSNSLTNEDLEPKQNADNILASYDVSDLTENSDVDSVGKLKHEIQLLSIKVFEKDIELKNMRAEAAAHRQYLSEHVGSPIKSELSANVKPLVPDPEHEVLRLEGEKLRRFLMEVGSEENSKSSITQTEYEFLKSQDGSQLSLVDLVKLRLFESVKRTQQRNHVISNSPPMTMDAEAQTKANLKTPANEDCAALERQLSLVKQNNDYLCKQVSLLKSKLEVCEQRSRETTEELQKAEAERASAVERSVAAEKLQQILQDQLKQLQSFSSTALPVTFIEHLRAASDSRRDHEEVNLRREVDALRSERDTLKRRLETSELETKRLRDDLTSVRLTNDRLTAGVSGRQPDVFAKTQIFSLETQLSAACAARNDALRQVERVTEKFELASKALYELDAERKVQVSQLEAKLEVASHKLSTYERLEAELDKAIENCAERCYEDMLPSDVLEQPAMLLQVGNFSNSSGGPLLPTLASRRLEHCIQLSRRLAESEKARLSLKSENDDMKKELQAVKEEAKRISDHLSTIEKPTSYLASALVSRDSRIAELLLDKRKLEVKMRRLYDCTKDLLAERKAMLADLHEVFKQHPHDRIVDKDPAYHDENRPPVKLNLPRKVSGQAH
uniref:GRIP domain-containing protein n=1 Tax=Mesocestoides corti TaxID=53468 RepID=A0A5K3FK38_MESCO